MYLLIYILLCISQGKDTHLFSCKVSLVCICFDHRQQKNQTELPAQKKVSQWGSALSLYFFNNSHQGAFFVATTLLAQSFISFHNNGGKKYIAKPTF